jgi:hypothetical protein
MQGGVKYVFLGLQRLQRPAEDKKNRTDPVFSLHRHQPPTPATQTKCMYAWRPQEHAWACVIAPIEAHVTWRPTTNIVCHVFWG